MEEKKRNKSRRPRKVVRQTKKKNMSASNNVRTIGNLGRNAIIVPNRMRRKLTYCEPGISIVNGTINVAGTYVFSANGLYDPNITGAGHQPLGFDQWMLMYDHYTVHSAVINVVFMSGGSAALMVAISRKSSATPVTDVLQLVENGNIVIQHTVSSTLTADYIKMSMSLDVAQYNGVDNVLDMPELRGTAAANPAEESYFHLSSVNNLTGTAYTMNAFVEIVYDATFTEPRPLTLS